jgi:WD40 repeat protein
MTFVADGEAVRHFATWSAAVALSSATVVALGLGCSSPKASEAPPRAPGAEHAADPGPSATVASSAVAPNISPALAASSPAAQGAQAEQPKAEAVAPLALPPAKLIHVLQHPGSISSLSFDPTGLAFVSGCSDRRARLWSADKGRLARTFADHSDAVSSVAFRFDGAEILSGSLDGTAKSWDPKTGRRFATTAGPEGGVASVAYSADGRWFALGGVNGRIAIADPADEGKRFELTGHGGAVRALAFAQKHEWLASRAEDGVLALWDLGRRTLLQRVSVTSTPVSAVFFAPDETEVIAGWAPSGAAALGVWATPSGRHVRNMNIGGSAPHATAMSADRRLLAIGTFDGVVELWDFMAGQKLQDLRRLKRSVLAMAFSADAKYVAAAGDDRAVAVWQLYQEPTEPPGRAACLERCHKRNMYTDCADETGGMVPCPCRCP